MKLRLVLTDLAIEDILSTHAWYEDKVIGLGDDFLKTLDLFYDRLLVNPKIGRVLEDKIYLIPTTRFPYLIFYSVTKDTVRIIRVLHQHQHPDTWKKGKSAQ